MIMIKNNQQNVLKSRFYFGYSMLIWRSERQIDNVT